MSDDIQAAVDAANEIAEGLLAEHDSPLDAVRAFIGQSGLMHYHEPWDAAFLVLIGGEAAPVVSEARDAWFVDLGDGRRFDCKKVGVDPPVTAYYRPEGHDGPAVDVEWHPVEGEEDLWRAVGAEGEPMPDVKLAMLSFDDRHPKPPEELSP